MLDKNIYIDGQTSFIECYEWTLDDKEAYKRIMFHHFQEARITTKAELQKFIDALNKAKQITFGE